MKWLQKPSTLIITIIIAINVLYLIFVSPSLFWSGNETETTLGARPEMTGLGTFAYIGLGLIVGLVPLIAYILTLIDIIKKKPGTPWIILIILCLILPFILGLLGFIDSIIIIVVWWVYARKQYLRKSNKGG